MKIILGVLIAAVAVVNAAAVIEAHGENLGNGKTTALVPESQRIRDFSDRTLAKVVPGHTTKADVEVLLGKPWRDTELDAEDVPQGDPSVDVWEYRGRDSHGTYRVHIEFDKHDVTALIAKIPDKTARAVARVAKPTPGPDKP
jgi:outer membrane protein assembly factor BamE (lipoprotein component of BamABCDE complex)